MIHLPKIVGYYGGWCLRMDEKHMVFEFKKEGGLELAVYDREETMSLERFIGFAGDPKHFKVVDGNLYHKDANNGQQYRLLQPNFEKPKPKAVPNAVEEMCFRNYG